MPISVNRMGCLIAALPLCVLESLSAQSDLFKAYECLRDAMYNSESVLVLEYNYARAVDCLRRARLSLPERNYWSSRIEYMAARGYQAARKKPQAIIHYEEGLDCIDRIQAGEENSESWRMRSELLGHLCLLKDLGFLLKNGRKVVGYAGKALELNPESAGAQIIIAASKVYTPVVFGGNPRKGLELMRKALAMGTAEKDDLFNIYSGIGLAFSKLRDKEEAKRWFEKALELYPGNSFVRTEYGKLAE